MGRENYMGSPEGVYFQVWGFRALRAGAAARIASVCTHRLRRRGPSRAGPRSSSPTPPPAALPLVRFSRFSLRLRQSDAAPRPFGPIRHRRTSERRPVIASSTPLFSIIPLIESAELTGIEAPRATNTTQPQILPYINYSVHFP